MKLIDKEILLLKIDSKIEEAQKVFNVVPSSVIGGMIEGYTRTKKIINSLEVKDVDLEEEIKEEYLKRRCYGGRDNMLVILNEPEFNTIAKHFFELGLSANNPITATDRGIAEEIIINLKRVEKDYRIELTKEIEWVRNQVKKGEDV